MVTVAAAIVAVGTYLRRDGAKPVEIAARPAKPPPSGAAAQAARVASPAPAPKPAPPAPPPPHRGAAAAVALGAAFAAAAEAGTADLAAGEGTSAGGRRRRAEPPEQPDEDRAGRPIRCAQSVARACSPRAPADPRPGQSRRAHVPAGASSLRTTSRTRIPSDPRPWLLLGRAYAQLDWYSDSVERYVRAHHVDSTCRGDPQMLADLLKAAAHPTAGRGAARAIRDIYGVEAIPALEKAMERRAGDREATARLTRLRESLPR